MWVKIQHQMEVLNPIYMAPNMTALTKMTKRQKFWIFILHCLMKRDGVDRMFPLIKWDISEWDSGYEPKIISWGLIKLVGNSHVYQAPKSNCFIAARAIGAHKALFNV